MANNKLFLFACCLVATEVALAVEPAADIRAELKSVDPTAIAVDIRDATQLALGKSPRLRQAEAERNAQTEHRRASWADVGPRVKGEYNEIHLREPVKASFGPQPIIIRPELTRTASLTVAQPITGGYALVTKARFDGKQEDLKELALRQARADVAFQATDMWLKAYEMQRQLEIAEFAVQVATSQANDGAAMERAGRLNHADSLRLQLAISESRSVLAKARAGRDTIFAALREALGLPLEAKLVLKGNLPKLLPPPTLDKALAAATDKRLERKQAEAGVALAGYGKKFAYAQYVPSVNVFAKVDRTIGQLGLGAQAFQHTYGVNASWDLWTNGSSAFAVREAAQSQVAAEEAQQNVEKMVRLDVQQALANFSASQEALAAAELAVTQAEEVYRIQAVRFKTGAILSSELLMSQNARDAAQARLVSAQTDLVAWNLKTQKALGLEQPQL
ncbi:MAG: TolC family protein [Proteobacteria bacterium]|nr:TolC family protein [Pseudomonadota bacterium]